MDKSTVETMLQSGHASLAHLAHHFKVSLVEMAKFLRDNEIAVPSGKDEQYHYLRKLETASRPEMGDWESLLFDDLDKRWINGVDTLTVELDKLTTDSILRHYHGENFCPFTGKLASMVMALDGNTGNFLVTNNTWIAEDAIIERFKNSPRFVVGKEYSFESLPGHDCIRIGISLLAPMDLTFGSSFKELYIDAAVDQWLRPYFEHFNHADLMPPKLLPTAEFLALWVWRHLSTVALLKGLARIEVERDGVTAIVTKEMYLQMVVGIIQRAAQSRNITSPSSIVTPQQAAREGMMNPLAGQPGLVPRRP